MEQAQYKSSGQRIPSSLTYLPGQHTWLGSYAWDVLCVSSRSVDTQWTCIGDLCHMGWSPCISSPLISLVQVIQTVVPQILSVKNRGHNFGLLLIVIGPRSCCHCPNAGTLLGSNTARRVARSRCRNSRGVVPANPTSSGQFLVLIGAASGVRHVYN